MSTGTTAGSENPFRSAAHTIVVSDIHLADAEPPHPHNPLWKRFKRQRYFVDPSFKAMLDRVSAQVDGPIELILNGDIFDFDSVMAQPKDPSIHRSWLERRRGLNAEEAKSRFKIATILHDHPVWVEAIRKFILAGNRVIFVIGNHDIELHWPSVQQDILDVIAPTEPERSLVRFCEWFYISNADTLVEHANQYDAYSLCNNPIHPLIRHGSKVRVRIPFGNLAGRIMLNGMGLFNPHAESSYIRGSLKEYMVFYYKYLMRTQPFLVQTWFWSAIVTLVQSVGEGILPAMVDPLTVQSRVEGIAHRANSSTSTAWLLREVHAHPAIYNPWRILRELWLDRAILLVAILIAGIQVMGLAQFFLPTSFWWFVVPVAALMPALIFYARGVESEVAGTNLAALRSAPIAARIAGVRRVVQGHTHQAVHCWLGEIEYLNPGTWSPAFADPECTKPEGKKCAIWIKPSAIPGAGRTAELLEWNGERFALVPALDHPSPGKPSAA